MPSGGSQPGGVFRVRVSVMVVNFAHAREDRLERGGVLVELAFVAPVLIFLIVAVMATGSILGQLAWMSQTAFQTYLIGAEYLTDTERLSPMQGRSQLLDFTNSTVSRNANRLETDPVGFMTFSYDDTDDSLTTVVHGRLETLLGPRVSFDLNLSITGALLAVDGGTATPLDRYLNPERKFDCSGVRCPIGDLTCGTLPCVTCLASNPASCTCVSGSSPAFCP